MVLVGLATPLLSQRILVKRAKRDIYRILMQDFDVCTIPQFITEHVLRLHLLYNKVVSSL